MSLSLLEGAMQCLMNSNHRFGNPGKKDLVDFLRTFEYFQSETEDEEKILEQLAGRAEYHYQAADSFLFHKGYYSDYVFILMEGEAVQLVEKEPRQLDIEMKLNEQLSEARVQLKNERRDTENMNQRERIAYRNKMKDLQDIEENIAKQLKSMSDEIIDKKIRESCGAVLKDKYFLNKECEICKFKAAERFKPGSLLGKIQCYETVSSKRTNSIIFLKDSRLCSLRLSYVTSLLSTKIANKLLVFDYFEAVKINMKYAIDSPLYGLSFVSTKFKDQQVVYAEKQLDDRCYYLILEGIFSYQGEFNNEQLNLLQMTRGELFGNEAEDVANLLGQTKGQTRPFGVICEKEGIVVKISRDFFQSCKSDQEGYLAIAKKGVQQCRYLHSCYEKLKAASRQALKMNKSQSGNVSFYQPSGLDHPIVRSSLKRKSTKMSFKSMHISSQAMLDDDKPQIQQQQSQQSQSQQRSSSQWSWKSFKDIPLERITKFSQKGKSPSIMIESSHRITNSHQLTSRDLSGGRIPSLNNFLDQGSDRNISQPFIYQQFKTLASFKPHSSNVSTFNELKSDDSFGQTTHGSGRELKKKEEVTNQGEEEQSILEEQQTSLKDVKERKGSLEGNNKNLEENNPDQNKSKNIIILSRESSPSKITHSILKTEKIAQPSVGNLPLYAILKKPSLNMLIQPNKRLSFQSQVQQFQNLSMSPQKNLKESMTSRTSQQYQSIHEGEEDNGKIQEKAVFFNNLPSLKKTEENKVNSSMDQTRFSRNSIVTLSPQKDSNFQENKENNYKNKQPYIFKGQYIGSNQSSGDILKNSQYQGEQISYVQSNKYEKKRHVSLNPTIMPSKQSHRSLIPIESSPFFSNLPPNVSSWFQSSFVSSPTTQRTQVSQGASKVINRTYNLSEFGQLAQKQNYQNILESVLNVSAKKPSKVIKSVLKTTDIVPSELANTSLSRFNLFKQIRRVPRGGVNTTSGASYQLQ